jgi:hypothetical protein
VTGEFEISEITKNIVLRRILSAGDLWGELACEIDIVVALEKVWRNDVRTLGAHK